MAPGPPGWWQGAQLPCRNGATLCAKSGGAAAIAAVTHADSTRTAVLLSSRDEIPTLPVA